MPTKELTFEVTDEMRRGYAEDGFFVTPRIFEPAVTDRIRDEFNRIWKEQLEDAKKGGDANMIAMVRERPFLTELNTRSKACDEFLRHPALLDLARQMIGPDADVPWPQAILKAPTKEFENSFAWHQDHYYAAHGSYVKHWNRERLLDLNNGFQCWVAITRATVANGTLWVAPGKHKNGFLPHERDPVRKDWVCKFDDTGKRPVEIEAGQALIFTGLTPHYSGPNTTNEVRMAYQFGVVRPGTTTVPTWLPIMRDGEPVWDKEEVSPTPPH